MGISVVMVDLSITLGVEEVLERMESTPPALLMVVLGN
jgi:hypothetical protein